jgi:hypothetical protein
LKRVSLGPNDRGPYKLNYLKLKLYKVPKREEGTQSELEALESKWVWRDGSTT